MTKNFIGETACNWCCFRPWLKLLAPALAIVALATGCQTNDPFSAPFPSPSGTNATNLSILRAALMQKTSAPDTNILHPSVSQDTNAVEPIILREGDVLKISFPANANLNTTQPIRRDGMISMSLVGELRAAGKTPKELEKELANAYSTQLLSKEIIVEVQTSTFPVYVTGAVLRPGKEVFDHPVAILEAVMEAGGPDYTRANLKAVKVTRLEDGQYKTYTLNVKEMQEGKRTQPFYLKPGDVVKVPERLWY